MTTEAIEGLPRWGWRRKADGTPQRRVKAAISATYGSLDERDPRKVAEALLKFADGHDEAQVDIDHTYEDHPSYSCELGLELVGWADVTEKEVESARRSGAAKRRREAAQEAAQLEARLAEVRRAGGLG